MAGPGALRPLDELHGVGGDLRLITLITEPAPIGMILTLLGEPLEPPPRYS
jgi:hypothetical protein